jgi:hypothetical protein
LQEDNKMNDLDVIFPGANGKLYVEMNYTRDIVRKKLINLVETVVQSNV